MNEELPRAISAGVVVQTPGGYRCRVCEKDVTEIAPHLRGKDHHNNLAWEAIRDTSPHQFLLDALPPVVREAKQRSELELVDKTHFSYRCLVCTRRPVVNGIIPLKTHLNGNEHKKAKNIRVVSPISPPAPSPTQHSPLPPSNQASNPYPTLASSNTNFTQCQPPREQPSSLQQHQYPLTCNPSQYPSFDHPHKTPSPLPLTQSPTYYPTHQPRLPPPQTHYFLSAEPSTRFESLPTTVELSQPAASPAPYTSTAGGPHSNAPLQPAAVPFEARGYDPELQSALTAQVVAEVPREGGPPSFKCRACDKDLNGSAPCLEHLRSEKHKKKAQAWKQQLRSGRGPAEDRRRNIQCDGQRIGDSKRDQGDGSREFKWTVLTGTRPFPPGDSEYSNHSVPRGRVLIFNYFTGQGENERLGAKRDSFNLETLFDLMGYDVLLCEDYSKSRTEEVLTSTLNDPDLKDYDSFIVFILSHGKDDQIFFTTSLNEEDSMKLDDVRYKFTDTACPPLSGKPKLFFVNFCRARAEEPRTAYDGMAPQSPGPKNIVTLYSCINTFMSPRDPEKGTFFVQAWCDVLAAYAHNEELRDLYDRACQRLEEMNGSVPELQIYRFKKFYFNPGR